MGLTPRRRLAWFTVTAFIAIFGIGEFARWVLVDPAGGPGWWGIDLQLVVDAGGRLAAGQPIYADPRFLYPPLAALVAGPLTHLDFLVLSWVYAVVKVAIAAAAVLTIGRELGRWQQLAAVLILVLCLPFLHDVMLGNANVLLVGAMVPALFGRDRARNGILLGLATAIFAKPLVLPVLLWLLVWRRQTWLGTVVTGLAATVVGVLVTGPGSYLDWIQALLAGSDRFAVPFAGNHGVTALVPGLWLPVAALTTAGLLWVLARRSEAAGLTWAVTAGLLIAPYAGTYSALPLALAVPGLLASAPTFSLAMVALSTIATGFALPFYALAALLAGWTQPGPRVTGWLASLHRGRPLGRQTELQASER
ncbi:MAG TPA: glycosyltransferase family 87 protein [Candidatus Limnocylindrales bacterium]|nr:glycosyltransferase family 87 protein [Candidatus Limnocylindrales bacterium]